MKSLLLSIVLAAVFAPPTVQGAETEPAAAGPGRSAIPALHAPSTITSLVPANSSVSS